MKLFSIIPLFLILSLNDGSCYKQPRLNKGKLVVKGICMNYTIKLLEGSMDTTKIMREWKDEVSGITYSNVFGLGSVCSFPSTINEGDEFYFTIDNNPTANCAVCLAYYPKPSKSIGIKVVNK